MIYVLTPIVICLCAAIVIIVAAFSVLQDSAQYVSKGELRPKIMRMYDKQGKN